MDRPCTCTGRRGRSWREKRKKESEWRELRGEVNFSRVRSDKDEATSTLSPEKYGINRVDGVVYVHVAIVPISGPVKFSRYCF